MNKLKKATLYVKGMHCPSCDILIQDKFKEVNNVKKVTANYRTQEAEVCYVGNLDKTKLNQKINEFGYTLTDKNRIVESAEPLSKRLSDAGIIAILLFIAYFFAQEFKVLPDFNITSSLTLTSVFILGLVASTSTCMATSGALFLSTIGKLNNREASMKQNIIPAISFNVGRVLSYGVFGFAFGFLGKTVASNFQLGSFLSLFVAVMMVLIGLDMLKLFSFSSLFSLSFTKGIFEKLEHRFIKSPKETSFFLGAITYLLPCGFTQAVTIYALGLANPVQSASVLMVFALGTVPALIALGFASSFTKHSFYPTFQKIIGVLVFAIGISYIGNALTLYGVNTDFFARDRSTTQNATTDANVTEEGGFQIVKMNVNAAGYQPDSFIIKQGMPVKWIVTGENVFGCQGTLLAPKADIQKTLEKGENTFEFTPKEKGVLTFSCSMGMFRGQFNVI